jgi:hypothetical protein
MGVLLFSVLFNGAVMAQSTSFSGRVKQVWYDGFSLNTGGGRSIIVDADDICGDHTDKYIRAGEQVTVIGEFDEGEFDAFAIVKSNGDFPCGR